MGEYITDYAYYLNNGNGPENANIGSYQYITAADIITNYMMFYVGDDKAVDNVKEYDVRFHAKQLIKKLNFDTLKRNKVVEITIGSNLKAVMPHDYVDYVRISQNANGVLRPLSENRSPFSANAYLNDNAGGLMFDSNGEVLYGTSEFDMQRLTRNTDNLGEHNDFCSYYSVGAQYGIDPNRANTNPLFRINHEAGVIDFDSNMRDESIVLEYISDGMENGNDESIVVSKFFEDYMYLGLTARILRGKRGISAVEKKEAKRDASAELRNAKLRSSDLHPSRLLMTLRQQDKIIK